MTPDAIASWLGDHFPDHDFETDPVNERCLILPAAISFSVLKLLRDRPETAMDYFDFCTCVDWPPERLDLVYSLYSSSHKHRIQLKVNLDRACPSLASICSLWENANWNEREIYDLYGVVFQGHPDLRRLMMPEDWEGYPLRKDYCHPNLVVRPD